MTCDRAERTGATDAEQAGAERAAQGGLHASLVRWRRRGVLISGASGAGKSRLAALLTADGGWLVADDRVSVRVAAGRLVGSAPKGARGLLELRGQGLAKPPCVATSAIDLAVALGEDEPERLPDPRRARLLGIELPLLRLASVDVAALARVQAALFASFVVP